MAKIQKTSKSSDSSSTSVRNFPSSVIVQILIKLPIKSIIRSKCVCKSWKNLISDKYFSNFYLKNSPYTVLMQCEYRDKAYENKRRLKCFNFFEIGPNGDKSLTQVNLWNKLPLNGKLELVNSCNGLLCLVNGPRYEDYNCYGHGPQGNKYWDHYYNNELVYIVNPIVGDVIMLPKANWKDNTRYALYDFGFCTQSNLYKVLRAVKYGPAKGHDMYFEVFTVGVDHNWRSFQDSSLTCNIFSDGLDYKYEQYLISNRVVHDGIVYFSIYIDKCRIYGFDLEKEKGCIISLPSEFEYMEFGKVEFSLCDGDLCVCARLSSNQHIIYIWRLERFGIPNAWLIKGILETPYHLCDSNLFLPHTHLRDGDLLMLIGNDEVTVYNEKTKVFRRITDGEKTGLVFFGYVPNFVPMSTIFLPKDCRKLSSSNALHILELSDHLSNPSLKEAALDFIVKNLEDIVFSQKFDAFALQNPHLAVQITRASSFNVFRAVNSASPLPESSSLSPHLGIADDPSAPTKVLQPWMITECMKLTKEQRGEAKSEENTTVELSDDKKSTVNEQSKNIQDEHVKAYNAVVLVDSAPPIGSTSDINVEAAAFSIDEDIWEEG